MKALLLLLMSICSYAQTARFPSAIATDRDVSVQKDRSQSQLTGSMTASATSMTVVTGSKFAEGVIATIDNEQMMVCSVVGSTVNIGYASCPNVDGRGWGGTVAASHSNGALVSANVVSWNHNALKEEVKAVEDFLGVDGGNVVKSWNGRQGVVTPQSADYTWSQIGGSKQGNTSVPQMAGTVSGSAGTPLCVDGSGNSTTTGCQASWVYLASGYNFAAISSGTSLGVGNTAITVGIPAGMNGSDYNHYVWVSGGTGTSEACLINGGAGTAGSSGQIILNCAYTHSGAYTITSVAGGVPEAIQAAQTAGGGTVVIDSAVTANFTANGNTVVGSYPAAVTVSGANVNVSCTSIKNGLFASSTYSQSADLMQIQPVVPIFGFKMRGCAFQPSSSGTAARYLFRVRLLTSGGGTVSQFAYWDISGNRFGNFDGSSYYQGASGAVYLDNTAANTDGIWRGDFSGNNVTGGLKTTNLGDSVNITDNRFDGDGPGIRLHVLQAAANSGASQTVLERNNFWVKSSGPLVIERGSRIDLVRNNFETSSAATGSNDAMVDVQGSSSYPIYNIRFASNFFSMQDDGAGGTNYHYAVRLAYAEGIKFSDNAWGGATADQGGVLCTANAGDIFGESWTQVAYPLVPAHIAYYGCAHVNTQILMGAGVSGTYALGGIYSTGINYLGLDTGSNNAIATNAQESATMGKIGPPLTPGLCVSVYLAHTLQAGANTFDYQGSGAVAIRSHRDIANNIGTAYAINTIWQGCYTGTFWVDMSQ
jgi:hypothetical protein